MVERNYFNVHMGIFTASIPFTNKDIFKKIHEITPLCACNYRFKLRNNYFSFFVLSFL